MKFDPRDYEDLNANRYEAYLNSLKFNTDNIKSTVEESIKNLKNNNSKSFIIYGEPQSGKTSMMIALTARLLDEGYKFIIILVQDNLHLEGQNLKRFELATLNPTPKKFFEILPNDVDIKDREIVIFCKKNSSNLLKLLKKVDGIKNKVIIDDEADYASPNSKINKVDADGEESRTKINERIFNLLKNDGVYIGVTATPARLDLNNTFLNENHRWVFFQPHKDYKGQDFFFPLNPEGEGFVIDYNLNLLRDEAYNPNQELKDSVYRYLINASFLNLFVNKKLKNYIMLIHTSGKMEDHKNDKKIINQLFIDLSKKKGDAFINHLEKIQNLALKKTNNQEQAKKITRFIAENADKNQIGVLNSDKENKLGLDLEKFSEDPSTLFTISIGGNIISRGITFNNLLSMFFTRGVKTIMQQDTYIQRARMFGNRGEEAKNFELTIPNELYKQWFSCFLLHRLSYLSARNNHHQVWLQGSRTRAVSPNSIDKANVRIDKGEISFEKTIYKNTMEADYHLINKTDLPTINLRNILNLISKNNQEGFLPLHVIDFISAVSIKSKNDVAIHNTTFIENFKDGDCDDISRPRGIFGSFDYNKFPLAKHHFKLVRNKKGYARMFYNFRHGKVSFLRNTKNKIDPIELNQFASIE
jgi:hypothetical protein